MLPSGMIKYLSLVLFTLILAMGAASAGPLVDPEGLLSDSASAEIREVAEAFKEATGHWMVFVVASKLPEVDLSQRFAPWERQAPRTPIGIVYAISPKEALGELTVIAPAWREVAGVGWIPLFPQRLLQKYGDAPFERRVVKSAQYLANTFPAKIAFLLKPDSGPISEESTEYARRIMKIIEYFCYFIILFTFYRTFFPARVRDEDTDDFSNELRRLKKERQIW
ncbi:MAG: hypothetical protein HOM58_02090 [Rhodospirillaceae bacterium]|jgi:hypothetical protein|nr:hypothetical protein [Rhodospirillaceae bacterium]